MKLSNSEREALAWLAQERSVLVTKIPDETHKGILGEIVPGHPTFRRLEKKGLCFYTEEDPDDDGFVFTNTVEVTDLGAGLVKSWSESGA